MPNANTAEINSPRANLRSDRSLRPIANFCALASRLSMAIQQGGPFNSACVTNAQSAATFARC